ncbi:MAG: hypothetical protein AAF677_15470 [Pseudomonadota bacterium]
MFRRLGLALCITALAGPALGTVVGGEILKQRGDGVFVKLDPSTAFVVGNDTFNDPNLYAFDEDQNITLTAPIRVDIGGNNGMIPADTVIASHYVFFDSIAGAHYGYVDFDAPILGIAAFVDTMAATDFLANTSVHYVSPDLRGLERGDYVWIDEKDPNRLWVFWAGSSPGDYIRVFTAKSDAALM